MASGRGSGKNARTWIPWILVVLGFITAALALLITAIATAHWIDTVLPKPPTSSAISGDALLYSRYQGLLKTCYTGGDVSLLPARTNNRNRNWETITASKDQCIWEEAYPVFSEVGLKYNSNYLLRAHALRGTVGTLGAGGIFLIIAALLAFCAMCSTGKGLLSAVGAMTLIASILIMVGMGLFTWVYFLQDRTLGSNYIEFYNGWKTNPAYQSIISLSRINFGWSYMLGWIAAGVALIGAIMAFISLCCADPGQSIDTPKAQKAPKIKKQKVGPEGSVLYPQEMVAPANQRVDVVRVPTQPQMVETPTATLTRYENPPAYYNTPAVIYRPQNVTSSPLPVATSFYQGNKMAYTNGHVATARIYNDAASSFTPREYIESQKIIELS